MNLTAFLSENALQDENLKIIASKRFVEKGEPVPWEIKSITTEEDKELKKMCTKRMPVPGQKHVYQPELNYPQYITKLAVACTVFPNLHSAELQDSYGVKDADALLLKMLKPGEYGEYVAEIQKINGFDIGDDELVEEAKN
jgi:hypothetical protein